MKKFGYALMLALIITLGIKPVTVYAAFEIYVKNIIFTSMMWI